ncbi:Glucose-1-phosphate adenylyltransferase [Labrenzia sp. THAF82]|uniref:nucleotidyltransferase family protein n=1 Tax=Labrenzia sp. THAF82 TaxID=2587861 RepID=UPI0012693CE2|nr:nucleotidyltransferase family protein [Labrenzia sp. THAF82]QFT34373.1 Glucose-1-phosphate adenylyltransferase [Labrenzia sp. THAF82]
MRAVLLAAGFGTRLRPVTDRVPKALVPVDGRPLLEYWLHSLFHSRFEEVLINTHYLPDQVNELVANSLYRDRITVVHEETLQGTAGTIRQNAAFCADAPCLVAHADNLCICDFNAFQAAHRARPAAAAMTMMTFEAPDPTQCGIVKCDGNGLVQEFHEKVANPPGTRASAAVHLMEPEVLHFIERMESDTPDLSLDVVPTFLGRIFAWHNDRYHMDIGTLQTYGMAQIDIRAQRAFMEAQGWFS